MDLLDYLEHQAKENPEGLALQNNVKQIKYRQLLELVNHVAVDFLKRGLSKNSVVILKIYDKVDWVIAFYSLLKIGCIVVPISDQLKEYEIEQIKAKVESTYIVEDLELGEINLYNKLSVDINPEHMGGIYHMTSGSTGEPKFCFRGIKQLTAEGESYKKTFNMSKDEVILSCAPIYHSFALGAACISALITGACLYPMNVFNPRKSIEIVKDNTISFIVLVPTMAKFMCTVMKDNKEYFSKVRVVLSGAGKIDKTLFDEFYQRFGIHLSANYGSTETGGAISRIHSEPYNSIGVPMHGVEIKILDSSNKPVSIGEQGIMWIKTQGMLTGYLNNQTQLFDEEGFYCMQDIAYQDKDLNVFIVGRNDRMLNIAGKKVDPVEIETILNNIEQVEDSIVVGIEKDGKTRIKAYVVAKNITKEEIRRICKEKLSSNKTIAEIEFIEEIPRNELGKKKSILF